MDARLASLNLTLVGTPNSGKTALFNALTGSRQRAANYPGVTVERKIRHLRDAGGPQRRDPRPAGHLFAAGRRSPDEQITRDVVLGGLQDETVPDCIVCVADATNLRLSSSPCPGAETRRAADAAGPQHDGPCAPPRHRD